MNAKDEGAKLVNHIHRTLFTASKGRLLGKVGSMQVVLLHTTGAKTGKRRSTMLTAPIADAGKVVLVGSYGGDDREPAWFKNLRKNPDVEITMQGSDRKMNARVATAEEKAALWPDVVRAYKGYAEYQTKTTREIPLAILTPTA